MLFLLRIICIISILFIPLKSIFATSMIEVVYDTSLQNQNRENIPKNNTGAWEQWKHTWNIRFRSRPMLDTSSSYRFFLQKYNLSCEIAALRMLLESARWIIVTEEEIIQVLPRYTQPLTGSGVWGDPDREFVWDILGSQYAKTGYGIYEKPLVAYLESIGVDATFSNGFDGRMLSPEARLQELLIGLGNNSRIMLWGDWCTRPAHEDGVFGFHEADFFWRLFLLPARNSCSRSEWARRITWLTPGGKKIEWISGEHTFILLWYYGYPHTPTHIIVWDTSTGRHVFPIDEWMRKWKALDYRSLTIFGK